MATILDPSDVQFGEVVLDGQQRAFQRVDTEQGWRHLDLVMVESGVEGAPAGGELVLLSRRPG